MQISKTDPAPWNSIQHALHRLVECIEPSTGVFEIHDEDAMIARAIAPDGRSRVVLPTVDS
jgi:hypothetical protein